MFLPTRKDVEGNDSLSLLKSRDRVDMEQDRKSCVRLKLSQGSGFGK
jgi:hypothetical protein